jgi:peptide/nickel transport system substrate-binding protein
MFTMKSMRTRVAWNGRTIRWGVVALGVMLVSTLAVSAPVANAAGARHSAPAASVGSTLTIASGTAPTTLNPVLSGNGDPLEFFLELSYDSLIRFEPNGTYAPDLATSWGYVGTGNTVFTMKLRSGVRFSDGSYLTAAAVKAFLEYYAKSGTFASRFNFKSITVTGPLSLKITLNQADPELPYYFNQDLVSGDVTSAQATAHPTPLGTTTDGAGPYVLDASATVTGTKYVYVPNKYYWNPSAIHWKKVVVDIISDPTATLDALKTGEVQVAMGQTTTAAAAKSDGLKVFADPYTWDSVFLMDRNGKVVPALGNLKVRQALNYAVDRPAIAKALFGQYGQADDETAVPGYPGYNSADANLYPYNLTKAKKLLAEAGYSNGFSMSMLAYNLQPAETTFAQAIASEWSNIGVNVSIETPPSIGEYSSDLEGLKYPAQVFEYGAQPIFVDASEVIMPNGGLLNPFKSDDPVMVNDENMIATASAAEQTAASNKLETRVLDQAWFVPVATNDETFYVAKSIGGFVLDPPEVSPDPVDWYSAS